MNLDHVEVCYLMLWKVEKGPNPGRDRDRTHEVVLENCQPNPAVKKAMKREDVVELEVGVQVQSMRIAMSLEAGQEANLLKVQAASGPNPEVSRLTGWMSSRETRGLVWTNLSIGGPCYCPGALSIYGCRTTLML